MRLLHVLMQSLIRREVSLIPAFGKAYFDTIYYTSKHVDIHYITCDHSIKWSYNTVPNSGFISLDRFWVGKVKHTDSIRFCSLNVKIAGFLQHIFDPGGQRVDLPVVPLRQNQWRHHATHHKFQNVGRFSAGRHHIDVNALYISRMTISCAVLTFVTMEECKVPLFEVLIYQWGCIIQYFSTICT